jgi:hypothetical protein
MTSHDPSNNSSFSRPVSSEEFKTWLIKYTQQANLDDGYESRNTPDTVTQITAHSPSQTGGCHRKQLYQKAHAPRETPLPHGIFEFGNFFEQLFERYLRESVVGPQQFVRNPVEISFSIDKHTFQGSTDPVITNKQGTPLLLTECKTTGDISYVQKDGKAKKSHRIQSHIYAMGLKQRYNLDAVPPIYIIYADRSSLETIGFSIEWDPNLWDNIVAWADDTVAHLDDSFSVLTTLVEESPTLDTSSHAWPSTVNTDTTHNHNQPQSVSAGHVNGRIGNPDLLPPTLDITKLSEYSDDEITNTNIDTPDVFECSYCEFYGRCGGGKHGKENYDVESSLTTNAVVSHQPPIGFLPLTEYPIDAVIAHLIAHTDIYLTPTLAFQHPALVDNDITPPQQYRDRFGEVPQRPVYHWIANSENQYPFDSNKIDRNATDNELPKHTDYDHRTVRGPTPVELLRPDIDIKHS